MTPHDDVPAERDELREQLWHLTRDPGPLGSAVCALLNMDDDELYVELASDEVAAVLALLAPQETPSGPYRVEEPEPDSGVAMGEGPSVLGAGGLFVCEANDLATAQRIAAALNAAAPQEAREPGPPMRRVRAPKRRTCRDCGDTINTGESALRVGDDEVFHVGYQCGCAEKREAARPAPETVRELLGYVVERQRTPGEWVRVWTGRTLWFDHAEAVLERDAYALDGIPARIRGVYLGAPAPAEATERSES